jgi:hypothetical protein
MENMKVCEALVKAQKSFGAVLKNKQNPAFKSRYADLDACVTAVIDALNENGIALVQLPSSSETMVGVETIFVHTSGEIFRAGTYSVPVTKKDAQGYGSALTYARRYGLCAAAGIAPEDDDGNAASQPARTQAVREQPVKASPAHASKAAEHTPATLTALVDEGKAAEAAKWIAADQRRIDSLWDKLSEDVQGKITIAWPEA